MLHGLLTSAAAASGTRRQRISQRPRLGPTTFGIFDTFPNDAGRQAHLSGKVAEPPMKKAPELFAKAPQIRPVDVLAAKVPAYQAN